MHSTLLLHFSLRCAWIYITTIHLPLFYDQFKSCRRWALRLHNHSLHARLWTPYQDLHYFPPNLHITPLPSVVTNFASSCRTSPRSSIDQLKTPPSVIGPYTTRYNRLELHPFRTLHSHTSTDTCTTYWTVTHAHELD